MMVNRRFLYWGVFFIAAGVAMLIAASGFVDSEAAAQVLSLWPVLIIALGVGLLLRRTRFDLAGGMLAAATPGLLLGGLVVATPRVVPHCGDVGPVTFATRQGSFNGAAVVDLRLACGDLSVTTAPGSDWRLESGNANGSDAIISASPDRLSVASASRRRAFDLLHDADVWRLSLPIANRLDLAAVVNAGRGRFDLAGARLGTVDVVVNAGDGQVDLSAATVSRLSLSANAARVSLRLPAGGDLDADLIVNAGSLDVCAPSDLGLRIHQSSVLGSSEYTGLVRHGDVWESPGYQMANHHADVTVSVNVGSVDINPVGGCQ